MGRTRARLQLDQNKRYVDTARDKMNRKSICNPVVSSFWLIIAFYRSQTYRPLSVFQRSLRKGDQFESNHDHFRVQNVAFRVLYHSRPHVLHKNFFYYLHFSRFYSLWFFSYKFNSRIQWVGQNYSGKSRSKWKIWWSFNRQNEGEIT
jgi:hypothetical protein